MSAARVPALIDSALQAQHVEESDATAKNQSLQELIDHPSDEVFEAARRLIESSVPGERKLGVRILRELGRPQMPYAGAAVGELSRLLERERQPDLLVWTVSAIGNQHVGEALPVLWELATYPEPAVRDSVSGAISGAAMSTGLDDRSIDVLCRLSHDTDADVRFSAIFELSAWRAHGVNDPRITAALEQARHDNDPRVARAAMNARGGGTA
jgi:HEAT repeat protein